MKRPWGTIGALAVLLGGPLLLAWPAAAVTDAQKCEAAKNKVAGKYAFCRLKAEAKAVKTGNPVDYSKCDETFGIKWGTAETHGGGMCPTSGDQTAIQDQITADADFIALKLSGRRFVDNGDGTVSDTQTGLMWEQKDNLGGGPNFSDPHDADNRYRWSTSGTSPDGPAYMNFLPKLNNGTSPDGTTISDCFAGHCDWRLPTIAELQGIVDLTATGCGTGNPCIDAVFGNTGAFDYWSSTTYSGNPSDAWFVVFFSGGLDHYGKATYDANFCVRAVRGGS